jgi:hypothetical protein
VIVIVWQLELQLPMQLVPITTKFVSSHSARDDVCSIQHYVIKCICDLGQVSGYLRILQLPQPVKLFPPPR